MPTSNGLSYSMNSFPRIACTIGAFSLPASSINSACAPAQPAPPRIVIFFDPIENLRQRSDLVIGRTHAGFRLGKCRRGRSFDGFAQRDVSGQGNDRHATPRERGLDGDLQDTGHLLGLGHQLAVVAALGEEMLRLGLLEISAADLVAGNLRGDGEDRNTAAVTVVEPVDQMQVAGTAAAGADRQSSGEMRFRAGGKRGGFLMSHVNPSHVCSCLRIESVIPLSESPATP